MLALAPLNAGAAERLRQPATIRSPHAYGSGYSEGWKAGNKSIVTGSSPAHPGSSTVMREALQILGRTPQEKQVPVFLAGAATLILLLIMLLSTAMSGGEQPVEAALLASY